ncbi:MAG TPA: MlaD family protein [Thermoanaerobaculia bacterium]|nr:MlaD family protein [Thermoanaerobaculia bacterium]
MRKLGAILFLAVIAVCVWAGARWAVTRGTVKATIIFQSAAGLRSGDPVVANQVVVGKVTNISKLDDRDAVTIRLDREHRKTVVSDSLFTVDDRKLVVMNAFAVGAPIEDGAVIQVKEDRLSKWAAKYGQKVEPLVDKLKAKADQGVESVRTSSSGEAQKLKEKVDSLMAKVRKK